MNYNMREKQKNMVPKEKVRHANANKYEIWMPLSIG